MTDIEKLRKNHEDFERKVRAIRQDEMLSEKAKRLELEKVYSKASTTYNEFADDYRAEVRERLRESRKRAFAAEDLKLWGALKEELLNFRRKINLKTAHDSYEHWRESDHDDLVLATALACWWIAYKSKGGSRSLRLVR